MLIFWTLARTLAKAHLQSSFGHAGRVGQNVPKQGFLQTVRNEINKDRQTNLDNIARQFSISPATFKRKLKLHNTHFKQLQDELGKQQATYLLQIQQFSNEQSAHLMQFNDIPNFRRSVKRWTGLTPSQLRLTE